MTKVWIKLIVSFKLTFKKFYIDVKAEVFIVTKMERENIL